jgi:hypothetical protein
VLLDTVRLQFRSKRNLHEPEELAAALKQARDERDALGQLLRNAFRDQFSLPPSAPVPDIAKRSSMLLSTRNQHLIQNNKWGFFNRLVASFTK